MKFPSLVLTVIALVLSACPAARGESDSAFTDYDKIADAIFPPSLMQKRHHRPNAKQLGVIRYTQGVVEQLIEGTGTRWLSSLVGAKDATPEQWRAVKYKMNNAPVWVCSGECRLCGSSTEGCAVTREAGSSVASVVVVSGCFFDRQYCGAGQKSTLPMGKLFQVLGKSAGSIAYHSIRGARSSDMMESKKALDRSLAVLATSFEMMERLAGTCQGAMPLSGFNFLRSTGHLRDVGGFLEQCGKKMIDRLKVKPLPASCSALIDQAKWKKEVEKGILWNEPNAQRCDGVCEMLTCGDRDEPAPRLMQFGERFVLSLPEGACDGTNPLRTRAFLEQVLRRVALPAKIPYIPICAKLLAPGEDGVGLSTSSAGSGSTSSGPEIQLIE